MRTEYELKRDWQFLGGPESAAVEKLPAGTKLGVIETAEGSHMTPQQLADAVCRGLAGAVQAEEEEDVRKVRRPSHLAHTKSVKDE